MIEIMLNNLKGGITAKRTSGTGFHQLFVAIIAGTIGFCTFFTTMVFFKLINNLFEHLSVFRIDTSDLLLSSIGFICLFLISFLDNSSKKRV
jgi:hypothetical protein